MAASVDNSGNCIDEIVPCHSIVNKGVKLGDVVPPSDVVTLETDIGKGDIHVRHNEQDSGVGQFIR